MALSTLEGTRAMDTQSAAQYCGVSAALLRKLRKTAKAGVDAPQHTQIGMRVVYLQDDLDSWLERQRAETVAKQGDE